MRYRKRPVEVEAVQFTGENCLEVKEFAGMHADGTDRFRSPDEWPHRDRHEIWNESQDAWNTVNPGDWIIRGVFGELYPCENVIFRDSYEVVTT